MRVHCDEKQFNKGEEDDEDEKEVVFLILKGKNCCPF